MSRHLRKNPLVLLGTCLLLGAGLAGVLASVPPRVVGAQLTLPIAVSIGLLGYGWHVNAQTEQWPTVLLWTGYGVLAFAVVGFWFGQVSRLFETSLLLAIVASLSTGIAFGATVGVYSARLQQTNAELARTNEQMDQFVSVVSHDLRNPLTVAQGRLELATAEHESEHHAPIARSLDRIDVLIEDLLALARAGEQVGDAEPVDLATLSEQSWQTAATAAATLAVETERTVQADPTRLKQVLENLFRNAIEHGSDDIGVRIGDLPDGFYVADDGPGVPEDAREDVFENGFTTSKTGTGLGLSIVQQIAAGHGWSVTLTDSADGGARIEITGVE